MRKPIEGVLTDTDLAAMRQRNAERAAAAVAAMGRKYACHPANLVQRDPIRANFIPAAPVVGSGFRTTVVRLKGSE